VTDRTAVRRGEQVARGRWVLLDVAGEDLDRRRIETHVTRFPVLRELRVEVPESVDFSGLTLSGEGVSFTF
jgi:hypothetical protein